MERKARTSQRVSDLSFANDSRGLFSQRQHHQVVQLDLLLSVVRLDALLQSLYRPRAVGLHGYIHDGGA